MRHALLTPAANPASAGKADAGRAEFAKVGISAEVTQKVKAIQALPELGCGDQAATCPAVVAARAGRCAASDSATLANLHTQGAH